MASVELKDESPPAPRAEGLLRRLENGWLALAPMNCGCVCLRKLTRRCRLNL